MLLFAVKFARPICQNQTFQHSRPLLAVRFFTHTGFKSRRESAHLEQHKSRIPKKEPTWLESSQKQMGEEWQKAIAVAVFLGFSLLFVKGVRRTLKCSFKNLHQLWSYQGLSYNKAIEQALIEGTFVSNSLNLLRDNEKALFLLGFPIW